MIDSFPDSSPLLFLRMVGCTLILPGGYSIFPVTARLSTALVLSLVFIDSVPSEVGAPSLIGYLLEVIVGGCISLPFALVVKAFLMFGSILDQGRGQNLGGMYGAEFEQEGDGTLGRFFEYGILALLISSGLLLELVILLQESLNTLPIGSLRFHSGWGMFGIELLVYNFRILLIALTLFIPFGMLFVLCDLAVGLVSKIVPGLPVFAEMFIAKSAVTFFLLLTVLIPTINSLPSNAVFHAEMLVKSLFEMVRV